MTTRAASANLGVIAFTATGCELKGHVLRWDDAHNHILTSKLPARLRILAACAHAQTQWDLYASTLPVDEILSSQCEKATIIQAIMSALRRDGVADVYLALARGCRDDVLKKKTKCQKLFVQHIRSLLLGQFLAILGRPAYEKTMHLLARNPEMFPEFNLACDFDVDGVRRFYDHCQSPMSGIALRFDTITGTLKHDA